MTETLPHHIGDRRVAADVAPFAGEGAIVDAMRAGHPRWIDLGGR